MDEWDFYCFYLLFSEIIVKGMGLVELVGKEDFVEFDFSLVWWRDMRGVE